MPKYIQTTINWRAVFIALILFLGVCLFLVYSFLQWVYKMMMFLIGLAVGAVVGIYKEKVIELMKIGIVKLKEKLGW